MMMKNSKTLMHRPQNKIELPEKPRPELLRSPVHNFAVGRNFDVRAEGDTTEIIVYDVIGDYWGEGVSAKRFLDALDKVKTNKIVLKINSPGGDAFDGVAIYNDFKAHPAHKTVKITGLAASAASVIAMAGDEILIGKNAQIMIHNAWVMAVGNKNDFREVADILQGIDEGLAETYADRTGLEIAEIIKMMDGEKWMRGEQAIEKGFADGLLLDDDKAKAAFDTSMYAHTPVALKKEIEATLCEAGYSRTESKAAVNKGFQVLSQREAGGHNNLREQREAAGGLSELEKSVSDFTALLKSA